MRKNISCLLLSKRYLIINITYSFICDSVVNPLQCWMNLIVCNRNLAFMHIINPYHIKYVHLQLQRYNEIFYRKFVIFKKLRIFMLYFIFFNTRVHTPKRLFTSFNMITISDITVAQRLTALSKRGINTLLVTINSKWSNFTGYAYKYEYQTFTLVWLLFDV